MFTSFHQLYITIAACVCVERGGARGRYKNTPSPHKQYLQSINVTLTYPTSPRLYASFTENMKLYIGYVVTMEILKMHYAYVLYRLLQFQKNVCRGWGQSDLTSPYYYSVQQTMIMPIQAEFSYLQGTSKLFKVFLNFRVSFVVLELQLWIIFKGFLCSSEL